MEMRTNRTKHIEIRYFFVRDLINAASIRLEYCPNENMVADVLTKPLNRMLHGRFVQGLGMLK